MLNRFSFSMLFCIIVFAPIHAADRISEDLCDVYSHILLRLSLANFFLIIAILQFA